MTTEAATARAKELTHVVEFLQTEFGDGIDIFNYPYKGAGDIKMECIYVSRGINIMFSGDAELGWCEIYGITEQEFQMIKLIFNYRIKIWKAN